MTEAASHDLISLLEQEMQNDLSSINVDAKNEYQVTAEIVNQWYLEAEKLIRVITNTIDEPLFQAINQLRYAGHHVLKAQIATDDNDKTANLIEAYKHCKRAVYDALDFYVYKLNTKLTNILPLLDNQQATKAEREVINVINDISVIRGICSTRIEYYTEVYSGIVKGLKIQETINEIMRESGISNKVLKEKQVLVSEIEDLGKENQRLQLAQEEDYKAANDKFTKFTFCISLIIAIGAAIGGLSAAAAEYWKYQSYMEREQKIQNPDHSPAISIH